MQCREDNREVLIAYCARKLNVAATALLEQHLETCAHCRQVVSSQKILWGALDGWKTKPISLDFNHKLYQRLAETESHAAGIWSSVRRFFRPLMPFPFGPGLPLAAACVTLFVAFVIQTPVSREPPPQSRVEKIDADQVERALEDIDMLRQLNPAGAETKSSRSSS